MKLRQQIPCKASQGGKGSVKNTESERHKAYMISKHQAWNGANNKILKGSKKDRQ